ncbi:hypothetical protein A6770_29130 [Nostoc minutum NIES-26]|uniref:Uncharacterized protein n=1 Tax=Nostoc minutum NIES-26 TaxID=1844469 RepID=A0A367QFY2_9NOSO|nr:hypothetical protein A6770_29130 [Nostoc minutum NIES-26]
MPINRLFKGFAVVLTAMGTIVIIWLVVYLVQSQLRISSSLEGDPVGIRLSSRWDKREAGGDKTNDSKLSTF